MKRYVKTNTTNDIININIVVEVEEYCGSIAATKNVKRGINKKIPKNFSKSEYDDFIARVIAIIEDEYGFVLKISGTSDETSLSYYYTFTKQDSTDTTIKLVLGCRVSDHDDNLTPEGIARRKNFERRKAIGLKSIGDNKIKYDFISVSVNDKRFRNYKEAAEHVRELLDNRVVFVEVK